jgi:hypothetical protein
LIWFCSKLPLHIAWSNIIFIAGLIIHGTARLVTWNLFLIDSDYKQCNFVNILGLDQWYSTFFVRVTPYVISLQLCTLPV